jgi:DNA replication protein DnaD
MILLAVDQTLSAKDPTFGYLDSILDGWRKNSVNTREDAIRNKEEFVRNKEKTAVVNKKEFPGKKIIENKIRNLNEFIE